MGFLDSLIPKNPLNVLFNPASSLFDAGRDALNNTIFKKPPEADPLAATVTPPPSLITPTPIATDSDKRAASRKLMASQLNRKGRSSTILTDTLGEGG